MFWQLTPLFCTIIPWYAKANNNLVVFFFLREWIFLLPLKFKTKNLIALTWHLSKPYSILIIIFLVADLCFSVCLFQFCILAYTKHRDGEERERPLGTVFSRLPRTCAGRTRRLSLYWVDRMWLDLRCFLFLITTTGKKTPVLRLRINYLNVSMHFLMFLVLKTRD